MLHHHELKELKKQLPRTNRRDVYHYSIYNYRGRTYCIYEKNDFTYYQNLLYKRAFMGLKVYSPEELRKLTLTERIEIEELHQRTQIALNIWKQELTNVLGNSLLQKFFSSSKLVRTLTKKYEKSIDPKWTNPISFKDLGIKKKDIANKLIELGILPKNFYELKEESRITNLNEV